VPKVDSNQIIQALLNVGRNALLAIGERGRIVIRTRIAANVNIGNARHKLAAACRSRTTARACHLRLADTIFFRSSPAAPTARDLASRSPRTS
jgi:two-component system nitrogen regulation sensor histidine kinase GlnL